MIHFTLTLTMTTAQVVKTSVTDINKSPIQDYGHSDDHTQPTYEMTPGVQTFHSFFAVNLLSTLSDSLRFLYSLREM